MKFLALFIPSRYNAYRPHMLEKSSLAFMLLLVLAAEGQIVLGAVRDPLQVTLAASAVSSVTSAASTPLLRVGSAVRQVLEVLSDPQTGSRVLAGVATLLLILITLTFFMHIQVQPLDLLGPGAVVALIALSFLALNATALDRGGSGQAADAQASLAQQF